MKKLFTTFRSPVDSFPLGEQHTGILKPGRYNGYDELVSRGGLDITIRHSQAAIKKTGKNNQTQPNFGAVIFPTGQILHDDDTNINLTIETNSGNVNNRIDLFIVENTYQEVSGGTPPIYSIIKGPLDGNKPTLPNPNKQIIVGEIYIDPQGYQFQNLRYKPLRSPLPGDMTYEQLTTIINGSFQLPIASETEKGIVQQATQQEVDAGIDGDKYVTSKKLENKKAKTDKYGLAKIATDQDILDGTDELLVTAKQVRGKDKKVSLTTNRVLQKSDLGKIFIGNSTSVITVTVPKGLGENFWVGFIAGSSHIKLVANTDVIIKTMAGRLTETKDLNTPMLLESDTTTDNYFLMGNLKPQ